MWLLAASKLVREIRPSTTLTPSTTTKSPTFTRLKSKSRQINKTNCRDPKICAQTNFLKFKSNNHVQPRFSQIWQNQGVDNKIKNKLFRCSLFTLPLKINNLLRMEWTNTWGPTQPQMSIKSERRTREIRTSTICRGRLQRRGVWMKARKFNETNKVKVLFPKSIKTQIRALLSSQFQTLAKIDKKAQIKIVTPIEELLKHLFLRQTSNKEWVQIRYQCLKNINLWVVTEIKPVKISYIRCRMVTKVTKLWVHFKFKATFSSTRMAKMRSIIQSIQIDIEKIMAPTLLKWKNLQELSMFWTNLHPPSTVSNRSKLQLSLPRFTRCSQIAILRSSLIIFLSIAKTTLGKSADHRDFLLALSRRVLPIR